MANIDSASRAVALIQKSMFFTLATSDGKKPWSIPLAFSVGSDSTLVFYSAVESLHSKHLELCPDVAASIFTGPPSVDGLQMSGSCTVVPDEKVAEVAHRYFTSLFSGDDLAWWQRPATEFMTGALWRFYEVDVTSAYVIEQDQFSETRLDRRITVDIDELKELIRPA